MTRIPAGIRLGMAAFILFLFMPSGAFAATRLTLEDRLEAQRAIERVYYAHQVGTTRPFDEAVSREALEKKVLTYLRQSVALARVWRVPVTADALRAEMERIARSTRFPDRLLEVYAALGNDPFLVQECLARATLVDRLSRSLFASDRRIHAQARRRAEQLRERLRTRGLPLTADEPHRRVVELIRARPDSQEGRLPRVTFPAAGGREPVRVELDAAEFSRRRAEEPERIGEIGPLVEAAEAFAFHAVLSEKPDWVRIASYKVPKKTWDDWWEEVGSRLRPEGVEPVALGSVPLSLPGLAASAASGVDDPVTCSPTDTWDSGALDSVPSGRTSMAAVWTGSLFVVWGGYNEHFLATGGRYDPVTDSWRPTSTVGAPAARIGHTAVWAGSRMVIWGGETCCGADGYTQLTETGGRYDPASDTWSPTALRFAPASREYHVAAWTGSRMIVWGGVTRGPSGPEYPDTGGSYDPVADSWGPITTAGAPQGREAGTAVWTGSRMVVWGGSYNDFTGTRAVQTGGRYDPASDTWAPTTIAGAPEARTRHTAVWAGSRMIVWGGIAYDGGPHVFRSGGRYDPSADAWTPTTEDGAPQARSDHTAVWTGQELVVWGGYGGGPLLASGGRYDPATDSWRSTSTDTAPSARSGHVAAWTGSRMVVWGGSQVGGYPDTGGRYDPVSDSWTPTYSPNAPSPREFPTAVWTGTVMIVWGGVYAEEPLATGGRYDPLTDSWSPTTMTGVPGARVHHTAVWTGSRMIVWGGEPIRQPMENKGGRYDPILDAWQETTYVGAPEQRRFFTAVWTGSHMVIWGGLGSIASPPVTLDSGSRYDPVADSWAPTSVAGASSPRQFHTAVWSGSRMIVWGGSDNDPNPTFYNTGGQYDPVSNSWTVLSKGGAPKPRRSHTAVWTGTSMLVWGGTGSSDFDTGGSYDAAADRWSDISTVNAPTPRVGHTAVWTGEVMVVWGGEPSAIGLDAVDTGGRYDPVSDTWVATNVAGAPSPRSTHAAVWSGDFVMVWGGRGVTTFSSGGRYVVDNPDGDLDGSADVCDCAPADPGAFSTPGEVTRLAFASDKETLTWDSSAPGAGGATVHDVLRGALSDLPVGTGSSEICLASGIAAASVPDASTPASGEGLRYLVRGRNVCGVGSYGFATDGTERVSGACP